MTTTATRTAALRAARANDSKDKRQRTLAALKAMEAAGRPVTFPGVAKAAGVSTWLVYSPGIREHVEAARRRQADHGVAPAPAPVTSYPRATPTSLRADLAAARAEIKALRTERDKLMHRLRLQLGAEIGGPDRAALIAKIAELEAVNRRLIDERDARSSAADLAQQQVQELEDELVAVRESLRRVIRAENRGQ